MPVGTLRYAEPTDLHRLSLPSTALEGISTPDQEAALNAASDLADSYLRQAYDLPITGWEDDLRRAVCNIAAYDLMVRQGWAPNSDSENQIRKRYEDAIKWLERIGAGKAELTGNVVDQTPTTGSGMPEVARYVVQPVAGEEDSATFTTGAPRGRGW